MLCLWLVTQSRQTLWDSMDCSPPGSSVHGDSPDKNTGVGCQALLQEEEVKIKHTFRIPYSKVLFVVEQS